MEPQIEVKPTSSASDSKSTSKIDVQKSSKTPYVPLTSRQIIGNRNTITQILDRLKVISDREGSACAPTGQELQGNRSTLIQMLGTMNTLLHIRSRHEAQGGSPSSSRECPCTKRRLLDADIKYLQELMNANGFEISRADCLEAYQEGDMGRSALALYRTLDPKTVGTGTKRQKLGALTASESVKSGAAEEAISAAKLDATLKAVRWMQNKERSQYSFDSVRSEFTVFPRDEGNVGTLGVEDLLAELDELVTK